jgi:uncharacterized delta-60 repeat protein
MRIRRWGAAFLAIELGILAACEADDDSACQGAACSNTSDASIDVPRSDGQGDAGSDAGSNAELTLSVSPVTVTLAPGASSKVSVQAQTSSSTPIAISVTGLPAGVTAENVTLDGGTGTLTLDAGSNAPFGNATVTVVATAGTLTRSATLTLIIAPASGSLDTTFGTNGWTSVGFAHEGAWLYGLGTAADGAIIAGGLAVVGGKQRASATRLFSAGTVDTTFGAGAPDAGLGGGVAVYDLGWPTVDSYATSVLVESTGKLLLAGNRQRFFFSALRTTDSGALDPSFGSGGMQAVSLGGLQNVPFVAMAKQPDGKIILAGSRSSGPGNDDFAIARLTASGELDDTFGTGDAGTPGLVILDLGGEYDEGFGVAVQPDGNIVVVGRSSVTPDGDTALVRLTQAGALDPSFGVAGVVKKNFGTYETVQGVALQSDGKIVVAGGTIGNGFVARFDTNGGLDPTFNGGNAVQTSSGVYFNAVTLQPDGKILAVGQIKIGDSRWFAIARYNTTGALDPTFGSAGIASHPLGSTYGTVQAVALQADGRIVVGGALRVDGVDTFGIARFWP